MYLFQIYEWCRYIRHLEEDVEVDVFVTASAKGEGEQLPDDKKHLIVNYYAKKIPALAALIEEYEKYIDEQRASDSQFNIPPFEQWQPSKRPLNTHEQSLLSGLSLTLTSIKRVKVKMPKTKRWVVYTAAKFETSLRVASSYVCINVTCHQPQFGRITNLYSHSFGGCNSFIAKIKLHQDATFDDELNMWHAPQQVTENIAYCF